MAATTFSVTIAVLSMAAGQFGPGLLLRLQTRPGDYVIAGMALADLWAPPEFQDEDSIRAAFMLGSQRTPYQDAEFALLQTVELAVRALSPGINDPFTAVMCIDRIAAALLANRSLPESFRLDGQGVLRVVGQPYEYGTLVESAFSQIRESGKTNLSSWSACEGKSPWF